MSGEEEKKKEECKVYGTIGEWFTYEETQAISSQSAEQILMVADIKCTLFGDATRKINRMFNPNDTMIDLAKRMKNHEIDSIFGSYYTMRNHFKDALDEAAKAAAADTPKTMGLSNGYTQNNLCFFCK